MFAVCAVPFVLVITSHSCTRCFFHNRLMSSTVARAVSAYHILLSPWNIVCPCWGNVIFHWRSLLSLIFVTLTVNWS